VSLLSYKVDAASFPLTASISHFPKAPFSKKHVYDVLAALGGS
jgi:hypothetical protein